MTSPVPKTFNLTSGVDVPIPTLPLPFTLNILDEPGDSIFTNV
jgi:hypothetical protein